MRTSLRILLASGLLGGCARGEPPAPAEGVDAEPPLTANATGGPTEDLVAKTPGADSNVGPAVEPDASGPDAFAGPPVGPDSPDAGTGPLPRPPVPDAAFDLPDVAVPGPDAAICAAETCNGRDDDCDGQIDDAAGCPCDVVEGAASAYLLCREGRNWVLARQFCQGFGYDLVVLEDGAEDAFVYGAISARGFGGTWLGLNDRAAEGQWVWLDGRPVPYSHWDQGEPNDGGNGGEDCGIVMTGDGRQTEWDDRGCESVRPFVCEATPDP
jgi:hypothetical protein